MSNRGPRGRVQTIHSVGCDRLCDACEEPVSWNGLTVYRDQADAGQSIRLCTQCVDPADDTLVYDRPGCTCKGVEVE